MKILVGFDANMSAPAIRADLNVVLHQKTIYGFLNKAESGPVLESAEPESERRLVSKKDRLTEIIAASATLHSHVVLQTRA